MILAATAACCARTGMAGVIGAELTKVDFSNGYVNYDGTINDNGVDELSVLAPMFEVEWDTYRIWARLDTNETGPFFVGGSVDDGISLIFDPGEGGEFFTNIFTPSVQSPNANLFAPFPEAAFKTFITIGPSDATGPTVSLSGIGSLAGYFENNNSGYFASSPINPIYVVPGSDNEYRVLIGQFTVREGSRFISQVRMGTLGTTVNAVVNSDPNSPVGSCCLSANSCELVSPDACADLGGQYLGDAVPCQANLCLAPIGGCCLTGGCIEIASSSCADIGGIFLGDFMNCEDSDSDGDGVPDACDDCPDDPDKIHPGACGCGTTDDLSQAAVAYIIHQGPEDEPLQFPTGIAVGMTDHFVMCNTSAHLVHSYKPDGSPLEIMGGFGNSTNDQMIEPIDVAIASWRAYIVEHLRHRVSIRNIDGTYLGAIGKFGSSDRDFRYPVAVALDRDLGIYVVDSGNSRIQHFFRNGVYLDTIPLASLGMLGGDFAPRGIDIDRHGRLVIADTFQHRIVVVTPDGDVVYTFGEFGQGEGAFRYPIDVVTDVAGRIFVTDGLNERVQVFDEAGVFLFALGGPGSAIERFTNIQHIAVDSQQRIYVTDAGNSRVQVFAPPEFETCAADSAPVHPDGTYGNNSVNIDDLIAVILDFGSTDSRCDIAPDFGDGTFGNGLVNLDDILAT
ncbi:MAG: NHL repeat-containing protein, partial [Phycisphaerales bacterium]|nr:NHL repeat-containing protein [Phycisphaerales bacterium]